MIFKKLPKIVSECSRPDESEDCECLKKVYNKHVKHRTHIFEYPGCNGNLRPLAIKEKLHVTEKIKLLGVYIDENLNFASM